MTDIVAVDRGIEEDEGLDREREEDKEMHVRIVHLSLYISNLSCLCLLRIDSVSRHHKTSLNYFIVGMKNQRGCC